MGAPQSNLATSLTMDDPVQLDADYFMDEDDRRFIDNEIQAIERHLVDLLLQSRQATRFTLDGSSAALAAGDFFLAGPSGTTVTKWVTGVPIILGMAATAATPGGSFVGITGGLVPPSITGLSTGSNGWVRVTSARCERVDYPSTADLIVGYSVSGVLSFCPLIAQPQLCATPTVIGDAGYTVLSTDFVILMGTRTAGRTVTLPASPYVGQTVRVMDASGQASTYNLTISGNGNNINGAATDTIALNYSGQGYYYSGGTYKWLKV